MKKGFSLIELMIVVAIIGLLSMVALPGFKRFIAKAKRAEAYMNLHSLYMAEKSYWAEHNKYSKTLTGPDSLNWQPEGNLFYTYGFPGAPGVANVVGKGGGQSGDLSSSRADQNSFVITAAADISGNGKKDIITIDHTNTIKIEQDGLA